MAVIRRLVALPLIAALGMGFASGTNPLEADQWGLGHVGFPEAWDSSTGEDVVVAVVDTGVDLEHPDLQGQLVEGYDFVDPGTPPDDPNGHGTHVAGIIAAADDDIGTVGSAYGAKVMPVRVLDAEGLGESEAISDGIVWAAENGADVINLSLGDEGFGSRISKGGVINSAILEANELGAVVVAAFGNEGKLGLSYRIGVDVIVVGAIDQDNQVASFSNVGDVRAVMAPGVEILSTVPEEPTTIFPEGTNGYAELDGTSMASPFVAGQAALLVAQGRDRDEVVDAIDLTAENPTGGIEYGLGVVDAAGSVEYSFAGDPEAGEDEGGWPAEIVIVIAAVTALVLISALIAATSRRRSRGRPSESSPKQRVSV
ncbi:MAG: Thermophilic serine proteinase [Acidimicrobiales bacterium]|nr:Thermophilic serine proteinase [Acidimicrobiales bacterium]